MAREPPSSTLSSRPSREGPLLDDPLGPLLSSTAREVQGAGVGDRTPASSLGLLVLVLFTRTEAEVRQKRLTGLGFAKGWSPRSSPLRKALTRRTREGLCRVGWRTRA